jgi:DNA (cytosine-5)-methyltransferase 1
MSLAPLKHGPWKLADLKEVPSNGLKVFSCFHCGGGSTMGYKLAGYEVLGGVEIDPKMMEIYRANHNPKHSYLMGVGDFAKIPQSELPPELYDLDILDGSPPCSSFSMAGAREKKWGKASKFKEGQAVQVLDDLFFQFIEVAAKLNPKVVVAENVKGLIAGNARGYVKEIFAAFSRAGYSCQLFLLNAAAMGVPQRRERVFFVANRLGKKLALKFEESPIPAAAVSPRLQGYKLVTAGNERHYAHGRLCRPWDTEVHPAPTQTATGNSVDGAKEFPGDGTFVDPIKFTDQEKILFQTFPEDFNFLKTCPGYVTGMSVPPYMMQRLALEIQRQFFMADT